jgi:hypothetical protein
MENNFSDVGISEKCAFCMESFINLSKFVEHLDKSCTVKKDLEKNKSCLNNEQRLVILCKDNWRKHSTEQLNQQLGRLKGTKGEESSVAGDIRS